LTRRWLKRGVFRLPHDLVGAQTSAVNSTIRARHTCFWGLFRSATIASRRARSAAFTSTVIPVRILQTRMTATTRESSLGLFRQILSTSEALLAGGDGLMKKSRFSEQQIAF